MMGNDRAIASLKEKIDGLNQLAWEVRVNDSPKAFQLSEESVKLARSINYTKGIAEGLRSLGFGYVRLFKNDEAAPLLREALSLFQSLNDIKGQAVVYEYLGIIERNWGNLGISLELLLKGYALIQQVDSLEIEVTSCYQIGVTYKHLGNHENALDYLYKALSIAKSSRNILMEAYATNIIGSIYFDNGDYSHALDCYQRGLVIRSESNDKWGEAGSLDNIGFTYLKLKDLDKAIDYCKQSLAISQSTGDKKGEANALLHLAEIYEQAGNIRQASKFSNESLEIRKARGDRRGETEALLFLAGLHKNSKDTENNQIFEWLSGALKIAQEIKAQDLLSKAYYDLHEYYTQNGNFKESLTHLEAHLQIEKELHKNTINQKISNLEISHKAETISQRNKELTELNAKIEKANEELKVEASLERVRAVAMGMKEPADMINVCRMISDQLLQLGFKEIRNVQTAIIYPQKHEYLNYQYFTPYDKESIETIDYRLHPDVLEFSNLMLSSTDAYYTKTFEGKELEDWREYRRQTNQLPDPKLDATTSSHYYFYSIGSGALGVTTYAPLNDGQIKLFKRFRNVFELAYRRFIDIEKALAQAREAQIEAALERVRAKSMAMHHSDDLITVINIVQEQLLGLGFHFHAANFVTDYSEKGYTMWLASPGESFPSKIYVPQVGLKYFEAVNAAIEKGSDFATYTLNFEEKNIYFRNLFESSLAKSTSEEGKRKVNESKGMASSVVLLDKVRLNLMNLDLIPFTDEENNILRRFGYVFEQSYTRFLDLQKAEAQAREAQTEVALERIRARAMAMHSSNELMDVAHILREQMGLLDQPDLETSVVNLFDEDSDFIHSWHAFREPGSSSGKTINGTVSFRKDSSELTKEMIGHYHSGKKEYTLEATGEKLNEFLQVLINAQPEISNYIGKNPPEKVYYHFATFTGGALLTVSYQPTTEDIKILQRRAASVFDLAYRRYLDLKKAEAQTREAQIEVAVERVRAKALAMHQSVEIMGVAVTMRKELESLNIPGFDAVTITLRQDDGTIRLWDNTSAKQHEDGTWENTEWIFRLEENNPDFYINRIWDSDKKYFVEEQDENDLLITIDMVRKFDRSMADVVEHHFKENGIKHVWHPTVQLTHGKLNLDFYGAPAPEVETILLKMGAAFDLAYKRFLDLKNAEAQTREAQIQLALERVRARTMAMHHSDELTEVVKMLYQEFDKLKLSNESTDIEIGLIDEETGNAKVWAHLYLSDGTISTFNFPFAHFDQINDEFKRWNSTPVEKRNELFITTEFSGDLWEKFKTLAAEVPELVEMFNSLIAANITKWVTHNAYFSHGLLTLQGTEHYSQETQEIQKRFAKVFEQTYTRFLDLKKAEAQAREAQIETGLERVRSKTMAMHKSEEVTGVAVSLNEELLKLGFEGGSTILIINRETGDTEQWTGFSEDKSIKSCYVPFFKHPYHAALMDSWKKGEHFLVYTIAGDEKRSLDEHYFTTGYKIFPESDKKWMQEMRSVTFSHAFMKYGAIHWGPGHLTEEQLRILQRFSKVFEQSYTRFLDLQKAEAQAREAQIEASLERVRARTMGMRNSNELAEVAKLLFEQVKQLGVETYTSGFNIWDNKHENLISWMSNPRGVINPPFEMPIHSYDQHKRKYEAWQKNELFMEEDLKEEALANHYKFLRSFPLLDEAFRRSEEAGIKTPDRQVHNNAYFSNGYLLFITLKSCPEAHDIFKRFAKVFDQTYTRFLDLQKAEAQARDAQIEVALERVRAKVMAMTNSKELNATSLVFGEQLRKLNIDWQFSYFWLVDESKNENVFWITWPDCKTSFTSYTMAEAEEYFNDCLVSWRAGIKIHDNYVPPEGVQAWLDTFQRIADDAGGEAKKIMVPQTFANGVYYYDAMMKYGSFGICISKPATEEEKNIQCRFAIEFERAYTRFLDLKQAEAQAREAQIELGLERVRARAMAMQNSGELNDLVAILFEELTRLDLILARCIIWIFDIDTLSARLWMANSEDKKAAESYYIKRLPHSYYESIIRGWKERNPKWVYDLKGDEKKTIDKLLLNETELSRLPDAVKNGILNAAHTVVSGSFNNFGLLEASGPVELSGEQMDIVSRFAKVFDLTYTRFNDLKQAEAQAREAQIELGLERVRARAMAMQKSGELKELIATVSTELSKLDIILDRCFIMTYDIKTLGVTWWMANPETSSDPIGLYVKYHEQVPYLAFLKAWQDRIVKWQFILEGSVKKTWDEFLFVETELSRLPGFVIDNMRANDKVYLSASFNNFGCLTLATLQPLSDEQFDIMLRFAKVFDLTYTRFNDLKQAEAQGREAQIELGLEKVRAKAMAMHKSDDLKAAVATVFEELDKLELGLIRCGIAILDKDQPRGDIWITLKSGQHSTIEVSGDEPLDIHPLLKGAYDGWLKQEDFSYTLQDEDLVSYYQAITKTNFQQSVSATFKTEKKDQQQYYFNAVFQDGSIFAFLNTAFTDEAKIVMRRFANVFNLTYKRFLDLQKAEAQAREARIETALEKVRASTMAMQRSEDLSQTAFVLFKQFKELGEAPERIFIATFDDHDSGVVDLWGTDQGGNQLNKLFKLPVNEPTMVSKIIAAWKEKKRSVVVDLKGEELKTYLGFLKQAGIPVTEGVMSDRRVQTAACFSNGVIGVTTSEPQSAEAVQLQERFAGVFDLTYTRFLDLQKAEAQAREAKIETALERVRARALAMQEPEELKEVAQVLRTEMGLLGVEELETCSIYINDESAEKAECWYALKDIRSEEKKLVNDHFALNLNDTWVGREMLQFYRSAQKQISIVMQGENRKEWIHYCEKHSTPLGGYYGEMIPDRTYHLYKFSHGAIGAAAAGDISEESWRMLKRAASVFSLAYSRFKDLTQARTDLIKLKEEKKRAEEALTELQVTQKQLIQSEKMASLGELTAGIAHEIQNPLNFVNNFSDVSNELLEEMKSELEKGNAEEAKAIAVNVKENLEKILHHGKRADAIVKGMLQHSRSSSGQKELTDINTLAEEYLRLAYHGLRAKDKFFHAKFQTDFDPSISKINIVPQEIGRVILNLINNSFYAVSEKKLNVSNGYEPCVTISTKKVNDKVEIRVIDNGNGIPQKVLDKIFQPFFTTKPTGQGTGLGLSLSYDIITKGHDGDIKVETKEGEGSKFIISLPVK